MAAPTNTPANGEIEHLSVDDLLAPLPETIRLGGPGPFVINLSTSATPVIMPAKTIAGLQSGHMYQVQRTEDRRPRFRLRLGPFADEDAADDALSKAREIYPGALTATADADDLRAIAALRAKAQPPQRPAEKSLVAATAPPASETAAASAPRPAASPAPATPVASAPRPAAPSTPAPAVSRAPVRAAAPAPMAAIAAAPPKADAPQSLDVEGGQASRWLAIQLSLADQAVDPDAVPNLDIFAVYRLYCVAGIDQGRIVHALRLGFFTDAIAAGAVASYLAAFYDKPTVKRVSTAEHERFAARPLMPRKDVGSAGKQAVIEITAERHIRDGRGAKTADKTAK